MSALWLEADDYTRARMWAALLLVFHYDFSGTKTIPSSLRGRCRSAIVATTPEIRKHLVAMIRSNSRFPSEISRWVGALSYEK
ncbi:MAG: hypothetical protein WCS43_04165 [Verrucomicrobiota bacterium]